MIDNDFLKAIRERDYYTFKDTPVLSNIDKKETDWNWLINFVDTHPYKDTRKGNEPKQLRYMQPKWIGWLLIECESRPSIPPWTKKTLNQLQKTFYKNRVTLQLFGGISNESKSGHIHKDPMDILYVQGVGKVNWGIWTTESEKPAGLIPKDCTPVYEELYTPGRACYVPRGMYHSAEPLTSRCGFSFGIEGDIDPSTYI